MSKGSNRVLAELEETESRGAQVAPPSLRAAVPPRVRRELAGVVAPDEEFRLAVTTDIRLDGRYGEAWLMATDDLLVAFSPDGGGPADLVSLPLAEIRGVEVREDLGTAALKVRTGERGATMAVFSKGLVPALSELPDQLEGLVRVLDRGHRVAGHLQQRRQHVAEERTVVDQQDVALGIDAISGDDGLDQASAGRAPTRLLAALALPLGRPRLAFIGQPGWEEVEADAAAAYEAAATRLGAEPLTRGSHFAEARAVHLGIMRREVAHAFAPYLARGEAQLSDTVRAHVESGQAIDAGAYLSLLDEADAMRRAFEHTLRPYDAALTPAAPGGAPEGLDFTGSRTQTMLWTMLGVPAVNVPVLAVDGLPLGLQVVGGYGTDATTLRAAAWCAARLQEARQ